MSNLRFVNSPLRYLRYHFHANPAIAWSISVGLVGPVLMVVVPPIRLRYFNDGPRARVPSTYPLPPGPRKIPQGYDDPE
ncbi:hypothetical protein NA57DRAFT_70752 [Rhizodiscina lignyota]|uniref:NADH-ubiquinone oxidoreductase 9.5 kDa subunit n=1 Tax=Rhizodiscina lignyota TaxID=1504668 RepID=A0A9P4MAY5_9PEZI|nr:hypothetical protein NA57DRAFT_70752 [Rhizodiscina lignyota]